MGYKELEVWQRAMDVVTDVYRLTTAFPASEQFGLSSQLRRAAVSVPTNVAEGYGRQTDGSFVQFLRVAKGSNNELETLLIVVSNLELAETEQLRNRVAKIGSMLTNLISKVKSSSVAEQVAEYSIVELNPLEEWGLEVSEPTRSNPN